MVEKARILEITNQVIPMRRFNTQSFGIHDIDSPMPINHHLKPMWVFGIRSNYIYLGYLIWHWSVQERFAGNCFTEAKKDFSFSRTDANTMSVSLSNSVILQEKVVHESSWLDRIDAYLQRQPWSDKRNTNDNNNNGIINASRAATTTTTSGKAVDMVRVLCSTIIIHSSW